MTAQAPASDWCCGHLGTSQDSQYGCNVTNPELNIRHFELRSHCQMAFWPVKKVGILGHASLSNDELLERYCRLIHSMEMFQKPKLFSLHPGSLAYLHISITFNIRQHFFFFLLPDSSFSCIRVWVWMDKYLKSINTIARSSYCEK